MEFEGFLENLISEKGLIYDAMKYSLMAGGKRLRPRIAMMTCEALGGEARDAVPYAAAVECVHTYSLIHDDLPSMDNDDLRRGKPTCHKRFDEATAILAGDGLLTLAFEIIADCPLPAEQNIKAVKVLSKAAGAYGMVLGQTIDMTLKNGSREEVLNMYEKKTGALICAAASLGAIAAGGSGEEFNVFSYNLGAAFQIRDDILDIEGDEKAIGKPVRSDDKNEKNTIITVTGIDEGKRLVREYTKRAIDALQFLGERGEPLKKLAESLIERNI